MNIEVIKSKIHKATVTEANLQYVGSITIDENLLEASNIIENEKVQIVNINNGERLETYVIKGERGKGEICLNGPAARKVQVGDVVIIIAYAHMDFEEAKAFKPTLVFPDTATNQIVWLKTKIINIVKYIIFLSIGITLLYFAFKGVPLDKFIEGVKGANYFYVGLNILFGVLAFISRAVRWKIAIEPLGYKANVANTFYALMIGYFANMAFPRLGEVTRCTSLHKTDKIPFNKLLGTVIIERALDLTILLSLMLVVFFLNIELFGKFISDEIIGGLSTKLASLLGSTQAATSIIIIVLVLPIALIFLFRKKIKTLNIYVKIIDLVKGVIEGIKTIYKMKKVWWFIFHTIFIWVNYALMTYAVFFAIPDIHNNFDLTFVDALFILIVGGVGMSLPAPGGVGSYHYFVSAAIMIYGVTKETAIVFATIAHEAQALLVISLGVISLIIISVKNKKNKTKNHYAK